MNPKPFSIFTVALILLVILGSIVTPQAWALSSTSAGDELESGLRSMVETIATKMKESEIRSLAVLPFPDLNGYPSALGDFIAEELVTALFVVSPGDFDVIERSQLARVLEEQELTANGIFDPDSIANFGKILGIDAVITGSISYLGSHIKINTRVISIETAKIFTAASMKIPDEGVPAELKDQPSRESGRRSNGRRPAQVQRHDVFFQNKFLRADVRSVGRSEDNRRLSVALELTNTSTDDLWLMLESTWEGRNTCLVRATDDLGNGVFADVGGLACRRDEGDWENRTNYLLLTPQARTTLTLTFKFKRYDESTWGSILSISLQFLRHHNDRYSRFSAGIANIELPPIEPSSAASE